MNTIKYVALITIFSLSQFCFADEPTTQLWELGQINETISVSSDIYSVSYINISNDIINTVNIGDTISIPTLESGILSGVIRYKNTSTNEIAGTINNDVRSNFQLSLAGNDFKGIILDPITKTGYEVISKSNVSLIFAKNIDSIICFDYPSNNLSSGDLDNQLITNQNTSTPQARTTEVSIFNSRPSSAKVLYLDFDGEYVVHPSMNGGAPIDAQPADDPTDGDSSSFNEREITLIGNIWKGVSEDYSIFDVNVTTERSKFDAAATNQRQQIIITSTYWYPGSPNPTAGVAFSQTSFSSTNDTPAWSFWFYRSLYSGSVISHELGHALNLAHDGHINHPNNGQYHIGIEKWGPIMGAPHSATLTGSIHQWSKGDYVGSTNTQDDLDILAYGIYGPYPAGLRFLTDKYGNTSTTAARAKEHQEGVIGANLDKDFFYLNLEQGQTLNVSANSSAYTFPNNPNLDIKLTLRDSSGTVLLVNNPEQYIPSVDADLNYSITSSGRYSIEVSGTGYTDSSYSYSNYGSVGRYSLTINSPEISSIPINLAPIYYLLDDEE